MSEKKATKLIEKLAEIYKAVGYLQKTETNSFQNFKYVSSSQVLTEIRSKMCELGVLLEPAVTGHNLMHFQNAKRVEQLVTELDISYTWINVDDPEDTRTITWYSQGKDSDEKGVGKALTYGEKFFLLKYFNIATDKHDPDAQQSQPSTSKPASKPKSDKPDAAMLKFLKAIAPIKEEVGDDVYYQVIGNHGVEHANELTDRTKQEAFWGDLCLARDAKRDLEA